MTERDALLCLNAVSGLGTIRIKRLIELFKSAKAIWKVRNSSSLCSAAGIGNSIAENILTFDCEAFLRQEIERIQAHQVNVITLFDDSYPSLLREISDPPIVLYVSGETEFLKEPGVALVGCRRASFYGTSVAQLFARDLAYAGVSVISGMARGIDTAAHQACIDAGGKTAAVLGSGLACIYPKENEKLARKISAQGCVISEFPMMTSPIPQYFPRRNRVISGLSLGVVVIEASAKSGSLITADCALDQGRDVFAVPGKVGQHQAFGTNRLIQQGAKLVMSAQEVLEDLNMMGVSFSTEKSEDPLAGFSEPDQKIFSVLSDEPLYIDDIVEKSGIEQRIVLSFLSQGECTGRIKRLPGQYFVKTVTSYK